SNTKKSTTKKKTTNPNKKSSETPKETSSKEAVEEPKVSNDTNDSSNKNKPTRKKKIICISLTTSLLALSIIVPSIIVCKKLKEKNNQIFFKDSDFIYLRKQIINLVDKEHMNLNSFQKVMNNIFKKSLLASNNNISNLIRNVEILNYQSDSITFKITLDSNYKYEFDSFNNEIIITNNNLFITYSGLNSIKFYD
ncbi:MAG: hypothetical protein K2K73_01960, partial [Ureaplasma sp.]|nr:hypothetical protein [Ureaplasma sp.]